MSCVFGSRLAKAGADVALFDIDTAHVDAINSHGIRVDGVLGEETFRIPATTELASVRDADLVLVLVDSSATEAAARIASKIVRIDGVVVTLQNGIGNSEKIVTLCGASNVLVGSTYNSAAFLSPGHMRHSNLGQTTLGEIRVAATERVRNLVSLLNGAGLPTGRPTTRSATSGANLSSTARLIR